MEILPAKPRPREAKAYCLFQRCDVVLREDPEASSLFARRAQCMTICPGEMMGDSVVFMTRAPQYREDGVAFAVLACDDLPKP